VNVGVTQRVDYINSHGEYRDALDQRVIDWVVKVGLVPVPIPNVLVDTSLPNDRQIALDKWLNTVSIDALLLSGGNDIGNVLERDLTESALLLWAENNQIPVLGICRGMQMMGVYAGGELVQISDHTRVRHNLQFNNIQDKPIFSKSVDSYHNFSLKSCPNLFKVLAKSEDGNIEAIKHKRLSWEAWMWHPEREKPYSENDIERFRLLLGLKESER